MHQRIRAGSDLIAIALLVGMGIHTVRTYLSMAGWVLGTGLSMVQVGTLLLAIWGTGLMGYPVSRLVGGRSPSFRLALLFGLLYLLYRALPGPYTSPLFGCLSVTAWLWLLPTALRAISLRGAGERILPGVLLGVALQIAVQTAMHGLDLVQLVGPGPALLSLALAALLAAAIRLGSAGPSNPEEPPPSRTGGLPGWSLIAWGPYLALQMTLLGNLGWIQWYSGWEMLPASAFALAGLALGAWLAPLPMPGWGRALAGLAATALLLQPEWFGGAGVWLLLAAQALLPAALLPALGPVPGRKEERTYLWVGLGSLIGIVLILLFYLRGEWKLFWPVMAGLAALPGLLAALRGRPSPAGTRGAVVGILALGAVALPLSLLPRSAERPPGQQAPAELTVLTYNVHQLFDSRGVPGAEAIARVLEGSGADLIGLQETGRGWNFIGGGDLVSWLRWRLPGYHVRYGKTEGDLVGNILLSRYPPLESGWALYDMKQSPLQRGYLWVRIATAEGEFTFVNTHLSAWRSEEADRINQVAHLLRFWANRPRFVMLGDLNARPGSEPIRLLKQGGLVDLPGALGLTEAPTFPSSRPRARLDYIFGSPDVEPVRAEILETYASDHRPVLARIRLR